LLDRRTKTVKCEEEALKNEQANTKSELSRTTESCSAQATEGFERRNSNEFSKWSNWQFF
jgi:hypothetical protein